ncbi:MAG: universal stress protein [Firmicutes bacterium]|nr:universal stress protein [Bacillota bacterium]
MKDRPVVIIPLDGSEAAVKAFGAAEAMTNIMGALLYIVHVTDKQMTEEELLKKLKIGRIEVKDFSLHQIINADVVDGILRFAASVDTQMIVMSSHGLSYNPERLLGSITLGIVQRAINPVMVIRPDLEKLPGPDWRPTKMLVPQDGTPTAAAVMTQVYRLAELTGADIDILNIGVAGRKPPTEVGALPPPRYLDHAGYDWAAWSAEFIERFYAQRPPGIELRLFEREGEPADVMIRFAAENSDDLIALGWHGHLEPGRAETVKKLLREMDRPVLLIWSRE